MTGSEFSRILVSTTVIDGALTSSYTGAVYILASSACTKYSSKFLLTSQLQDWEGLPGTATLTDPALSGRLGSDYRMSLLMSVRDLAYRFRGLIWGKG
jgi:hypothetical protein